MKWNDKAIFFFSKNRSNRKLEPNKRLYVMKESKAKQQENWLQPYVFLLKEGNHIHKDYLDYSLLLLQVGKPDVLYSPNTKNKSQRHPLVHLNKK